MIKPLFDRVLIEQQTEQVTAGGIYIPQTVKNNYIYGIVIEVGNGTKDVPPVLNKGDRVFFPKHVCTAIEYDGRDLLLLRECDVYAVVNPDDTSEPY